MNFKMKAQSAMEYLATYGWALLILALVIIGLYQLGIFSNLNSGKAPAGACSVLRPYGPGTTGLMTLQGTCNDALPEYVAILSGSNTFLQGSVGGTFPYGTNTVSIFAWVRTSNTLKQVVLSYGNELATGSIIAFGIGATGASSGTGTGNPTVDFYSDGVDSGQKVNNGNWHFIGIMVPGGALAANFVIDGVIYPTSAGTIPAISTTGSTKFQIGRWVTVGPDQVARAYNGSMANIQVYNTQLNSNQINTLYREGIGGVPLLLQNLVAWWPLDGNGQDYSGNGYNATFSNITYTTAWGTGYVQP